MVQPLPQTPALGLPMTVTGAGLLWFGWFGFNVMSAQTLDKVSGLVAVNSLMAMVGETVNNTEAVWLNNIKDQGPNVDIEGTALSSDAVANLISNLQKTGYFKNIEVKESVQDEQIKDMQAFQFTLTCERGKS